MKGKKRKRRIRRGEEEEWSGMKRRGYERFGLDTPSRLASGRGRE